MLSMNTTLAIGLASGFALLNLLLGIIWLICLRRSREAKRQLAKGNPPDIEKRPSVLKRKRPSHPQAPAYPRSRPDIRIIDAVTPLTHCEEPDYLARDRYTSPPKLSAKKRRATKGRIISPLVPTYDMRRALVRAPPASPTRLDPSRLAVPMGIARVGSGDTFDTASMYSTVSAPIDLHEQIMLSQPFSRAYGNSPVAQTGSTYDRGDGGGMGSNLKDIAPPAYPIATQPTITPHPLDFIDPLAPETYDKTLAHRRGRMHPPVTDTLMPRLPRPVSTPEVSSRKQSRLHSTSRFPTMPPPPSPLAKKGVHTLYREDSGRILPSPHSPGPFWSSGLLFSDSNPKVNWLTDG